jgi:hypothetical protein
VVVDLRLTRPCALLKGFQGNREISRDSCWSFGKTLEMHVTLARHLYSGICLDAKGQTATICIEIIDHGLNITLLYLYILEELRPLRVIDRTNYITPGRDSQKYGKVIL